MDADRWRRVSTLLKDALAHPFAERPAFLDEACAGRPDDRIEVESLLRHCDKESEFLEHGPGALAAALLADEHLLLPGDHAGPYTIVGQLGRGGMGVVYLAHDPRLDRPVALKMLWPEFSREIRQRERLKREARAAAAISHAGIAHVYALEETADGCLYIASEYVPGRTLRAEIDEGPLEPSRVVDTAVEIARAVSAAHARKVLHRDLKPENVMRAQDGTIKILDFGLAWAMPDGESNLASGLTQSGAIAGTPGYMAPEQLRGRGVSAATDVFAMGLLIYEMAVGRHAFDGTGSSPMLVRVLEEEPNRLPPQVESRLPGLEAVVRRCLEKEPVRRYETADALITDLERLGDPSRTPVPMQQPRPVAQETSWWLFHHLVISGLYVAMVYPAWLARTGAVPGGIHASLFLALVASAALATTVRLHLVFTARVHPARVSIERRRVRGWIRRADWAMSLLLLGLAAVAWAGEQLWLSALLATVSVCGTVAFLLIEPATTNAAFPMDA